MLELRINDPEVRGCFYLSLKRGEEHKTYHNEKALLIRMQEDLMIAKSNDDDIEHDMEL
jgi:hypothetical protein